MSNLTDLIAKSLKNPNDKALKNQINEEFQKNYSYQTPYVDNSTGPEEFSEETNTLPYKIGAGAAAIGGTALAGDSMIPSIAPQIASKAVGGLSSAAQAAPYLAYPAAVVGSTAKDISNSPEKIQAYKKASESAINDLKGGNAPHLEAMARQGASDVTKNAVNPFNLTESIISALKGTLGGIMDAPLYTEKGQKYIPEKNKNLTTEQDAQNASIAEGSSGQGISTPDKTTSLNDVLSGILGATYGAGKEYISSTPLGSWVDPALKVVGSVIGAIPSETTQKIGKEMSSGLYGNNTKERALNQILMKQPGEWTVQEADYLKNIQQSEVNKKEMQLKLKDIERKQSTAWGGYQSGDPEHTKVTKTSDSYGLMKEFLNKTKDAFAKGDLDLLRDSTQNFNAALSDATGQGAMTDGEMKIRTKAIDQEVADISKAILMGGSASIPEVASRFDKLINNQMEAVNAIRKYGEFAAKRDSATGEQLEKYFKTDNVSNKNLEDLNVDEFNSLKKEEQLEKLKDKDLTYDEIKTLNDNGLKINIGKDKLAPILDLYNAGLYATMKDRQDAAKSGTMYRSADTLVDVLTKGAPYLYKKTVEAINKIDKKTENKIENKTKFYDNQIKAARKAIASGKFSAKAKEVDEWATKNGK